MIVSVAFLLGCIASSTLSAGVIAQTLATAGPSYWGVLAGPSVADFALSGAGASNGNVGYVGTVTNQPQLSAPIGQQAINGNLSVKTTTSAPPAQVSGAIFGGATGVLSLAWASAFNASVNFAGMAANQTLSGINGSTVINAIGSGQYVVDVNGNVNLGIGQVLTINGNGAADVIINISGALSLNSGAINLTGGLTSSHVLLNFTGNQSLQSTGNLSMINATVLAPSSNVAFATSGMNGELIAGGRQVHLAYYDSVPEPGTMLLMGTALTGIGLMKRSTTSQASRRR